ncbi:MAG: DUF126 domain-containing protein [Pseudomonadota bacterium]
MSMPDVPPKRVLSGGRGIGAPVRGTALVSAQGFGIRYDLNLETGVIENRAHDLYGHKLAGFIAVFTQPKGGIAASWALAHLADLGIGPRAIVFRHASPIFAQGALFAGIPILHDLDQDPCTHLRTGDQIVLRANDGRIELCG